MAKQILDDLKDVPLEHLEVENTIQYAGSTAATYARTMGLNYKINPLWVIITLPRQFCLEYKLSCLCLCRLCKLCFSAMHYGGVPTDNTWSPGSYAWVNVNGLVNYVLNNSYGYYASCNTLGLGGLGFQPGAHVVMLTALNPSRYSAHTSDRLNYPWQSSLSTCVILY